MSGGLGVVTVAALAVPLLALVGAAYGALGRPSIDRRLSAYQRSRAAAPAQTERAQTFGQRVLAPLSRSVAGSAGRFMPGRARSRLQLRLAAAGTPGGLTPGAMWAIGLGLGGLLAGPFAIIVAVTGAVGGVGAVAGVVGMALIGTRLPGLWLSRRISSRRRMIQRELPDALDLIVVSVEAGLGLDAALAKVTQKMPGALADELARALDDIRLGRSRKQALLDLARRVESTELRQFVAAVVQTMDIGGDLGEVLRVQAESARNRRRQRAQEQAMKAPIKMILPLVFLVFPSILVVVLVPAGLRALAVL